MRIALEQMWHDVRYGARVIGRRPGFAIVTVLVLALGIGAATTVFSVVSAVMLRPLPYPNSDRLVRIVENVPAEESPSGVAMRTASMTQDAFLWWRDANKTFSDIAAYSTASMTLTHDGEPMRVAVARVSPSLFRVLGVEPQAGRVFATDDVNVVVLSSRSAARYFPSDRGVLGRTVTLDGVVHAIVGVMPAAFEFPAPNTEMWTPYAVTPDSSTRVFTIDVVARLKDDVTIAAATTEANAIGGRFIGLPPSGGAGTPSRWEVVGIQDHLVAPVSAALRMLMALVGLLLLIVWANVANLMTVRASRRSQELWIRRALGAGRLRLVRQVLTEAFLLAALGGAAGVALAFASVEVVQILTSIDRPTLYGGSDTLLPGVARAGIDAGVLLFTVAISVVTALVFSTPPALQLSAPASLAATRAGRRALTVAELAVATTLTIGAGLLIHSFGKLSRVDLGYEPSRSLTFELVLPAETAQSRRLALAGELAVRLRSIPGVEAAGFSGGAPLSTIPEGWKVDLHGTKSPQGLPDRRSDDVWAWRVSPDYLRAIGARLVAGRWIDARDALVRPRTMLVNRSAARRLFGHQSPLGQQLDIGTIPWMIVGVVDDVRSQGAELAPKPQAYVDPVAMAAEVRERKWRDFPDSPQFLSFAVRVNGGDPMRIAGEARALVRQLEPDAAIEGLIAMDRLVSSSMTRFRFFATLPGVFAAIAAALAGLGLYGVLAYAVAQRTREIGIRVAIGAGPDRVLRMVVGEGMALALLGIGLGVAGAIGLTKYLRGLLFGVTPLDLATFVLVPVAFALIALAASAVPARTALSIDPTTALRHE